MIMKKSTFVLCTAGLIAAAVIPIGIASVHDEETFKTTVLAVVLCMIVLAFGLPMYALWKRGRINKRKSQEP